jgi:transcriptional antiterminator NusG
VDQSGEALPEAPPPGQLNWYVIHTRGRRESQVEEGLRHKGLEVFLPRIKVSKRRQNLKFLLEAPLFPGYLFVQTDLHPQVYYDIIRIRGVLRLLGVDNRFIPVAEETVLSIQEMVNSGRPYSPWPYLDQGKKVRITDGPLAGITGIILEHRKKKRRLVVAVELFARGVAVELEDEAVEPYF